MLTADLSKVAAIFDAVVDLDDAKRESYLASVCAGDPDLRRNVEAMLAADAEAAGFLTGPLWGHRMPLDSGFEPADRVGPYEILRLIGRGGMGAVYLARRVEDFDRIVAIKVIDRLIPDRATVRRFLRERQILSSLDHPNIARLFDGGVTESGMPYLVMEYVEGVPIDEYCQNNNQSLKERLTLFLDVCSAITHAHRHLIVHCDLKPGNILVSEDGSVKLLDFGIAKYERVAPGDARVTSLGQVLATPHFASPEQLSGAETSTGWDIYSLGKVLSEVLPKSAGTSLTGGRSISDRLRQKESWVDIIAVVAKATSDSDAQRYQSVWEFGSDVQSVVDGKAVLARTLGPAAAVRSIIRRNATGSAAALVMVVVMVVFFSLNLAARREASDRAAIARGLSSFLVSLFDMTDPETRMANSISASEVLDLGTRQARAHLPADSFEYVRIIREIGGMYAKVGDFHAAQNLLSEVLTSPVKSDPMFIADAEHELGRVLHAQGSNDDARIHLQKSLDLLSPTKETADLYGDVLEELAMVAADQNLLDRADSLATACESLRTRWFGDASREASATTRLKATIRWRARDYPSAERLYVKSLSLARTIVGPTSLTVAHTLNDLGLLYADMGRYDKAGALLNEALQIKRDVLAPDHYSVAVTMINLAQVVRHTVGADSAAAIMRNVISILIRNFGMEHQQVAKAKNNLALYLSDLGRTEEAETEMKEALAIWKKTVGESHPDYVVGVHNLAISLRRRGDYRSAAEEYHLAAKGFRSLGPLYRKDLADALNGLGKSLVGSGDLLGAAASYRESLAIREEVFPVGHWRIGTAKSLLGETLGMLGQHDEAESLLRSGVDILRIARGPNDSKTREAEMRLEAFNSRANVATKLETSSH